MSEVQRGDVVAKTSVNLLKLGGEGFSSDFAKTAEELELADSHRVPLKGSVECRADVRPAGGDFRVSIKASFTLDLSCSRCLDGFAVGVVAQESYTARITEHEDPRDPFVVPVTEVLDLMPLLRETVMLNVPLKPVCSPDCEGLCPVCGAKRASRACNHAESATGAGRMRVLKEVWHKKRAST